MAATAWTTTAHPLQVLGLSTVIRRKSWWNNWATVTGSYNLVQSMISYSILILCWYFVDFFVLSRTTRWSSIAPSTCRFSTNINIMRYHLNYLNAAANIKDSHRQYYVFKSGSIVVEWVCVCDAAALDKLQAEKAAYFGQDLPTWHMICSSTKLMVMQQKIIVHFCAAFQIAVHLANTARYRRL